MGLTNDLPPPSLPQPPAGGASTFLGKLQNRLIPPPNVLMKIDAFLFDYAGRVSAELGSEITDHWTETNVAIQDHIGLRPVRITMQGLSGELVQSQAQAQGVFGALQNALTTIPGYLGAYTPGAVSTIQAAITKAQDIENQINKAVAQGRAVAGFFLDSAPTQTRQQRAYAILEALREARQLFKIVTPWRIYENMALETLVAHQDEETKMVTDLTVTLKQVRTAEVETVDATQAKFAGRSYYQSQPLTNVGRNPGKPKPVSFIQVIKKQFGDAQ